MADPTYDVEVSGIKTFISMQKDKDETDNPALENSSLQSEDFVPPRLLNKYKSKQVGGVALSYCQVLHSFLYFKYYWLCQCLTKNENTP